MCINLYSRIFKWGTVEGHHVSIVWWVERKKNFDNGRPVSFYEGYIRRNELLIYSCNENAYGCSNFTLSMQQAVWNESFKSRHNLMLIKITSTCLLLILWLEKMKALLRHALSRYKVNTTPNSACKCCWLVLGFEEEGVYDPLRPNWNLPE